jgi:hypothetical protein
MDIYELSEIVIDKPLFKYINDKLPAIIEILQSNQDSVVIDCGSLTAMDVVAEAKNPGYLRNRYLEILPNGIKLLTSSEEIIELLKPYIPTVIKSLTAPKELLSDLDYMSNFPFLEEITISSFDDTPSKEEFEYYANNTEVRTITVSKTSELLSNQFLDEENTIVIKCQPEVWLYKGIVVKSKTSKTAEEQKNIIIEANNVINNLPAIKKLLEKSGTKLTADGTITIREASSKINELNGKPLEITLSLNDSNEIQRVDIDSNSPKIVSQAISKLESIAPIKEICMKTENKTYDDFYYLYQTSKKYPFEILYGNYKTTYEGFANMRATIDYFKELINSYELSPIEKIVFAYDIMKTFKYQQDPENKNNALRIPEIIMSGNIVCRGYATFFNQILEELGVKTSPYSFETQDENGKPSRHMRSIITVDDDKYNIHGIYVCDPTWDSVMENLSIVSDENDNKRVTTTPEKYQKVHETFDALTLYRYFLFPLGEYEMRFPGEQIPSMLTAVQEESLEAHYDYFKNNKKKPENYILQLQFDINNLFEEDATLETIATYINAKRPSLETFNEILMNVRQAEGYTEEEAQDTIEKSYELHRMMDAQTNQPDCFFKPSTK